MRTPLILDDKHTRDVNEMFGRMTPWYDLQNRVFSLFFDCWWRRRLISSVMTGSRQTVIDMAAGTLDVTIGLLRRFPSIRVIASDICEPMMNYGLKKKLSPEDKKRVSVLVADARKMPLSDGCADAITIAFGIRNIRPRSDALREMYRLLAPGGRACILEFAPVSTPVLRTFYHWYLHKVMPKLAGALSHSTSAYDYFADTIENFPVPDEFSKELTDAGFDHVMHMPLTFGVANIHVAVRN